MRGVIGFSAVLAAGALLAGCGEMYPADLTGDYRLDDHPDVTLRIDRVDPDDRYSHTYTLCRADACEDGAMEIVTPRPGEPETPEFHGLAMEALKRDVMAETIGVARADQIIGTPRGEVLLDLFWSNGEPSFRVSSVATTSFRRGEATPAG